MIGRDKCNKSISTISNFSIQNSDSEQDDSHKIFSLNNSYEVFKDLDE